MFIFQLGEPVQQPKKKGPVGEEVTPNQQQNQQQQENPNPKNIWVAPNPFGDKSIHPNQDDVPKTYHPNYEDVPKHKKHVKGLKHRKKEEEETTTPTAPTTQQPDYWSSFTTRQKFNNFLATNIDALKKVWGLSGEDFYKFLAYYGEDTAIGGKDASTAEQLEHITKLLEDLATGTTEEEKALIFKDSIDHMLKDEKWSTDWATSLKDVEERHTEPEKMLENKIKTASSYTAVNSLMVAVNKSQGGNGEWVMTDELYEIVKASLKTDGTVDMSKLNEAIGWRYGVYASDADFEADPRAALMLKGLGVKTVPADAMIGDFYSVNGLIDHCINTHQIKSTAGAPKYESVEEAIFGSTALFYLLLDKYMVENRGVARADYEQLVKDLDAVGSSRVGKYLTTAQKFIDAHPVKEYVPPKEEETKTPQDQNIAPVASAMKSYLNNLTQAQQDELAKSDWDTFWEIAADSKVTDYLSTLSENDRQLVVAEYFNTILDGSAIGGFKDYFQGTVANDVKALRLVNQLNDVKVGLEKEGKITTVKNTVHETTADFANITVALGSDKVKGAIEDAISPYSGKDKDAARSDLLDNFNAILGDNTPVSFGDITTIIEQWKITYPALHPKN